MYHHFASKQDLFVAVFEAVETELCEKVALAALGAHDPVDQLRLGALCFLEAAASPEVRRIALLDAPSVLPVETRRALSEKYGLGLVREALTTVDAAGRLRVHPVSALAPVVLAALHEAATAIADGADAAAMRQVVEGLIEAITTSP